MTNTLKLQSAMAKSGLSDELIAELLGLSSQALNAKVLGKCEFRSSEIRKLYDILNLSNQSVMEIFFC